MKLRNATCKHFNGLYNNKTCLAHVEYDAFRRHQGTGPIALPCLPGTIFDKQGVTCPLFCPKTKEEMQKEDDEVATMMTEALNVIALIEQAEKKGQDRVPCPRCKTGEIRFVRAGPRRHLHAHCTNPSCFQMME